MDIQRKVTPKKPWQKYWYILPLSLLIAAGWFFKSMVGDASYLADKHKLVTATVERGSFKVNVRGTGVLKPLHIRWEAAQVSGRVEQVLIKPGSVVKEGDVLVTLSNPQLHRELTTAKWELAANKAESHAAYVLLESQLVDLDNLVLGAKFSYDSAKLKLDAETRLMKQGNATVSALDYQKSQLAVKQQQQFWQAQQQKAQKMRENLVATKAAQQARTGLVDNNYQRMKDQVAALQVRALTAGVVQQVSVTSGEQAQIGQSVALIANQQQLFAELQVQAVRARDIQIGQHVAIDTRNSVMSGRVSRIDPAVNADMVMVDVELTSELANEARPELTVDGLITINHIEDTLYVKRPVFAPKNSQVSLYKLSKDRGFADKSAVTLGISSVNKIQVVSGLFVGDEIIISDTSDWQQHQQIMIN
ncbi:efflux RND transporter periplasmic adaptor subunit [Psychrobium sp. 1_MG-2023]|uniref:efflux RND transporter periplasmic adaptor subunit n=1 Tax=Psychrobium sp. 1_MG-2023 TaxID=3062624 RepID=UPI000C330B4C|nr:HlyD family efflux transporter periplasmic adaptor subunit [Psychrobium sp. 1_MG-2023]MDP2562592.1 HlyD family efflux transporter periplasmic adaptor subunit [Psychrobium sp. 1_MG-2023]PKF59643.1 RND transporter [Alteromonadales bacterium alter-6D02]